MCGIIPISCSSKNGWKQATDNNNSGKKEKVVMAKQISLVLVTGFGRSGRDSFAEITHAALYPNRIKPGNKPANRAVERVTIEGVCNYCIDCNTILGRKILMYQIKHAEDPQPLLSEYIVDAWLYWLSVRMNKNPELKRIILSGAPEDIKQLEILTPSDCYAIINLTSTRTEAIGSILKRRDISTSVKRRSHAIARFKHDWDRFEGKTLPALRQCNGTVGNLDVSKCLVMNLESAIKHITGTRHADTGFDPIENPPVPKNRAHIALEELANPRSRASWLIKTLL